MRSTPAAAAASSRFREPSTLTRCRRSSSEARWPTTPARWNTRLTPSSAGGSVSGRVTSPSTQVAPVPTSRCSASQCRISARRRAPGAVCSLGLAVVAAASLGCALAPSFGWLLAARGVQAVGGAAAVCAALELLTAEVGSERTAAAVWAAAGGLGAAAGPAIGGILTDTISWKAIFVAQVPLALAALALVPHRAHAADHGGEAPGPPAPA